MSTCLLAFIPYHLLWIGLAICFYSESHTVNHWYFACLVHLIDCGSCSAYVLQYVANTVPLLTGPPTDILFCGYHPLCKFYLVPFTYIFKRFWHKFRGRKLKVRMKIMVWLLSSNSIPTKMKLLPPLF